MTPIRFLEMRILGNPLAEVLTCIGIILAGLILKRISAVFLSKQSFRIFKGFSQNQFSELFVELLRNPMEQLLTLLILYFAFDRLTFPASWHLAPESKFGIRWIIHTVYEVALFIVVARLLLRATDFFTHVLSNRDDAPMSKELGNFLKELIKIVLVVVCFFAGLRFIFNVNITALVASLGIGGLAVALAAQDTLGNLLASFIIYLDRPFKTGDHIESGDVKGVVEHVGFRSTRIRTLDKSLLTVPNKKMIDTALNNITLSDIRRVRMVLNLTYRSKPDQLLAIVDDIKKCIADHPETTDDFVVHFTDIDSSSLNLLVLYFVNGSEYEKMLQVKEEINIAIMHIVADRGCEFAFPTRTIQLQKEA